MCKVWQCLRSTKLSMQGTGWLGDILCQDQEEEEEQHMAA